MNYTQPAPAYTVPAAAYSEQNTSQLSIGFETGLQTYEDLEPFFNQAMAIQDDLEL